MADVSRLGSLEEISAGKKVYFVSDFHLGAPNKLESLQREKRIVKWLEHVKKDASAIFFVGDVFDFWFEYKHAIPKGAIRFQGKLAELADAGIPIFLFTGNHDLWYREYFTEELNIEVFKEPISVTIGGKKLYVGHGDGLGSGDHFFKMVKRVFVARIPQWLFRWIHPDIGISLAQYWSRSSRKSSLEKEDPFLGDDEVLLKYCKEVEKSNHHDLYIFGHRHLPLEMEVSDNAKYFNLGEWFHANTYLEFDGKKATLLTYSD